MIMRVSVGIHKDDIDKVIETYDLMSQRLFTHATPTLFNAGTPKPQMSSCFLLTMKEDSINGIYDTLKQVGRVVCRRFRVLWWLATSRSKAGFCRLVLISCCCLRLQLSSLLRRFLSCSLLVLPALQQQCVCSRC